MAETSKTLVIGSIGHQHVKCVDWSDIKSVNLVDYDLVVVNTRSLTKAKLKAFGLNYFEPIRAALSRLLISRGSIVVLGSPNQFVRISDYTTNSTYSWSPIIIGTTNESGDTIINRADRFPKYHNKFNKWHYYYYCPSSCFSYEFTSIIGDLKNCTYHFRKTPYIENRYEAMLSGAWAWDIMPKLGQAIILGEFVLLPYIPDIDENEAVKLVLEDLLQLQQITSPPSWAAEIVMPLVTNHQNEINDKRQSIIKLEEEISEKETIIYGINRYKGLLYLSGIELEKLFADCLIICGGNILEKRYSDEEFLLEYKGSIYLIECKGVNKSIARSHVVQLLGYLTKYEEDEGAIGKGILFGNAWRDLPRSERDKSETKIFPDNVISQATSNDIILLSSTAFFDAFCKVLDGIITGEALLDKIVSSKGVITFE